MSLVPVLAAVADVAAVDIDDNEAEVADAAAVAVVVAVASDRASSELLALLPSYTAAVESVDVIVTQQQQPLRGRLFGCTGGGDTVSHAQIVSLE